MVTTDITGRITGELLNWPDIRDEGWNGILLGNGASRAVWDAFAYQSLFEKACSYEIAHPLTGNELKIFEGLDTHNFEQVLAALKNAVLVNRSYSLDVELLSAKYKSIRCALVEAVHAVHVPWTPDAKEIRVAIRTELLKY